LQELQNAVSGAAQVLGATAGTVTDPCATVVTQVQNALPNFTAANLTYTVTITSLSGTTTKTTTYGPTQGSLTCQAAGDSVNGTAEEAADYPQTVTVSYAYPWLPLLSYGSNLTVKTPTSQLSATSTVMGD